MTTNPVNLYKNVKNTITIFSLLTAISMHQIAQADKLIIGRVERVGIKNTDFSISAKIDTGAKNSSINTNNYRYIYEDNVTWVEFSVTNKQGETIELKEKFIRYAKIKRKGVGRQERPVIEIDICIGNIKKRVEVNLVDRSNFNYPMLIGRSVLHESFIVDVDQIFTTKPSCQ